jgi:uncharacterized protein
MKGLIAAAAAGNPEAQFNFGVMYDNRIDDQGNAHSPIDDNGYSVSRNRAEAMRWLLRAAEQGLARAQMRLAELYAEEADDPEANIKACKWFILARANLSGVRLQRAQAGYEQICARMTSDEVNAAHRRARRWKLDHRKSLAASGPAAQPVRKGRPGAVRCHRKAVPNRHVGV